MNIHQLAEGKQQIVGLLLLRTGSFGQTYADLSVTLDLLFLCHTQTAVTFSQRHVWDSSFDDQMATSATEKKL